MRGWRAWLVLGAMPIAGCSAGVSSDAGAYNPGDPFGGQTGSITPTRGLQADASNALVVPGGDVAFVVQGCTGLTAANVHVSNADGDAVPVELVPLDGSRCLARASGMLPAGEYDVSIDGAAMPNVDLTVSDPVPFPTRIGDLSQTGQPSCGASFALVLDPAALAYAPLVQLNVRVDGNGSFPWVAYGTLEPVNGSVPLELHNLLDGRHQLELTVSVAGETTAPDPLSFDFDVSCPDGSHHDPEPSCSLPRGPQRSSSAAAFVALLACVLSVARRRSRVEPGPRQANGESRRPTS